MSIAHSLSVTTRTLLALVICTGVLLASILTTTLPQTFPILSIGSYQLSAFETGLALSQHHRVGAYYTFSPFNDYIVDQNGIRTAILTGEDFQNKRFSTSHMSTSRWGQVLQALQSYAHPYSLTFSLTALHKVQYLVEKKDDTLTIQTTYTPAPRTRIRTIGQTLQYSEHSIVFEPSTSTILSLNTDRTAVEYINAENAGSLHDLYSAETADTLPPQRTEVISGTVVLYHPDHVGYLRITTHPGQILFVDPQAQLIEIQESHSNFLTKKSVTGTMTIQQVETYQKL